MTKITKKIISFCLALAMVVTLLPTQSMTAQAKQHESNVSEKYNIDPAGDDEQVNVAVFVDANSSDFDNKNYKFGEFVKKTNFYKVGTVKIAKSQLENLSTSYASVTGEVTSIITETFSANGDTNAEAFKNRNKTWKITEYKIADPNATYQDGYHLDLKVETIEEERVAVAVYVTDGSDTFSSNYDLMDELGIDYVQTEDEYAPVGVINLPKSFFEGKRSPYITNDSDWSAVKNAIKEIDTSKLKGAATDNRSNKIYTLLEQGKVSVDINGTAGSYKTALIDWNWDERTDSIEKIDGKKYQYHLDLRLNTYCVYYRYVDEKTGDIIDENGNVFNENYEDLVDKKVSFWENDVVTEDVNNLPGMPTGYEVKEKYLIDQTTGATDKNYVGKKLKDGDYIWVIVSKPEEASYRVTFDLNGGQINGDKDQVKVEDVAINSKLKDVVDSKIEKEPTRLGYKFSGWSTSKNGGAMSDNKYNNYQIKSNTTFYAVWKEMPNCTVTYEYRGDVPADKTLPADHTYKYGAVIELKAHPNAPKGYTFEASDNWGSGAEYTVTGNVTFIGTWTANEVSYTIQYYYEKADDEGYSLEYKDESKTAKTGTELSVDNADIAGMTKAGFVYNEKKTAEENKDLVVDGDGKTKLKIYYDRVRYTLTFEYKNGSKTGFPALPVAMEYKYGQEIERFDNTDITVPKGYTFEGWDTGSLEYDDKSTRYRMPNQDFTIYAIVNANSDTEYTVTNYFENVDGRYTAQSITLAGTTDAAVNVYDADGNVASQPGYTFDQDNTDNVLEGTIDPEGTTKLKVYYKRNTADITYRWVDKDGNRQTDVDSTNKWGSKLEDLKEVTAPSGYSFVGWTTDQAGKDAVASDATLPQEGITLYGKIVANTDTAYVVEYYKQPLDMTTDLDKYELADKEENLKGTTDAVASFDKTTLAGKYTGFTFDEANSKLDITIAGDGSTVYKLYYTRNTYTVTVNYKDASGNTIANSVTVGVPYGGQYTIFTPAVAGYSPDRRQIVGTNMPNQNLEVTVIYTSNPSNGNNGGNGGNSGNNGGTSNSGSGSSTSTADANGVEQPTATAATVPFVVETVVAPAGQPVVVATPPQVVEDEDVPAGAIEVDEDGQAQIVDIAEEDTPLAAGTETNNSAWALVNLISMIVTAILAIILFIQAFKKKDEEEEAQMTEDQIEDEKKRKRRKLLGLIPAIAAIVAFVLTEDIFSPMAFVDKWTILMIIILVVEALVCYFTRKKDEDQKSDKGELNTI